MWGNAKWRKIGLVAAISLIVAALSWEGHELYEASGERHAGYNYQPASKPGFRISASTKTPTPGYKPSCNNPYNREDADLCAQWAAVEQTSETNRLASLAVQISVFALLFTVIGTGLLVWTFWETRETARRELRAYVAVKLVSKDVNWNTGQVIAELQLVNSGQTPAFKVWSGGNVVVRTMEEMERQIGAPEPPDGRPALATVHAHTEMPTTTKSLEPIPIPDLLRAAAKEAFVFIFGVVWYEDAFGNPRMTNYCFYDPFQLGPHDPPGWRPSQYRAAPFHNDST